MHAVVDVLQKSVIAPRDEHAARVTEGMDYLVLVDEKCAMRKEFRPQINKHVADLRLADVRAAELVLDPLEKELSRAVKHLARIVRTRIERRQHAGVDRDSRQKHRAVDEPLWPLDVSAIAERRADPRHRLVDDRGTRAGLRLALEFVDFVRLADIMDVDDAKRIAVDFDALMDVHQNAVSGGGTNGKPRKCCRFERALQRVVVLSQPSNAVKLSPAIGRAESG